MSVTKINQNFRNFAFLALGLMMPFSSAAISIFMILLIIGTLLDKTSYQKIMSSGQWPFIAAFFHINKFL